MSWLDKLKGLSGISGMIGNPTMILPMVVDLMPGVSHSAGRMRIAQQLAAYSAVLSADCASAITVALTQQRDLSAEEIGKLDAIQARVIDAAHRLHKYPKENVSIESLAAACGIVLGSTNESPANALKQIAP